VTRDPLLEVARLGRHLLIALTQLENEQDAVHYQHPIGDLDFFFETDRQLACRVRKRPHEDVRVLLGGVIV
jgi:hypothetical protein